MKARTGRTLRRVLFVNHVAEVSGAELSLLALIGRLDRSRFLPLVACPEGPLAQEVRKAGVRHIPLRLRRIRRSRAVANAVMGLIDVASAALKLAGSLRKLRIDVVHANSTTAFMVAGPAARFVGVPVVWHVRDLVELGRPGRLLYLMADAVACISEAVERHVARYAGDLDKLWTVTNGIDLDDFRQRARPGAVRREFDVAPEVPVVTMVSQFTPWKGHRFLLGALPRVKARFPEFRLLLVGRAMTDEDAEYREDLRLHVEEFGLRENVVFTGWRDDVPSILADSDLLVLPSRAEPFGRVALEALTMGKPVVGTNTGGLPEIVSHRQTGLLVEYGDSRALADALITLLDAPEIRRHMGQTASVEAQRFSITRTVNQLQNLYEDLQQR